MSQQFELFLYKVRLWTGLGMIFLIALQIVTGYALVGKVSYGPIDYSFVYKLHTQFSWVFIYFVLTHITVNLRFLFRRWWPQYERPSVIVLTGSYVVLVFLTLYIQFFR